MDARLRRAADTIIVTFGALALTCLFVKYAFGALIPIIFGALTASLIHPAAILISKASMLRLKLVSAVLIILLFGSLTTIALYTATHLSLELKALIERLSEDKDLLGRAINSIASKLKNLFGQIPALQNTLSGEVFLNFGIDLDEILINTLKDALSKLTGHIPSAAVNLATKIPEALLFIAVSLLSAYYFCCDREKIVTYVFSIIPRNIRPKARETIKKCTKALRGCLKAYFLIMILTFFELFIGFSLLRVDYSFLLALLISAIDVMPLLGTGTVIIPWSLFCLASGDHRVGIGLLILYAITLIVRQIVEPKIIGSSLGLHPLSALISTYIGIKLLGLAGVIIGPLIAALFGILKSAASTKPPSTTTAV
jgi:sporulation integral membrane protein YtvI